MAASALKSPHSWGRVAFGLGKIVLFAHIVNRYIIGIGGTEGISMVPTIPAHYKTRPRILYSALHRRGRWIKVGDIVTYTNPMFPNESGCKRVIGMPGDFVSVITPGRGDGDVEAVDVDDKWAAVTEHVIQVPEGHCWVAGDNLEWSRDSRLFGPLPLALIQAKVLAVVSPWKEAKWVGADVDIKDAQGVDKEWVISR